MKRIFLFLLLFLIFTPQASAHLLGSSFEKEVDGYMLDMGYSPEEFVAGETHMFDFAILDAASRDLLEFNDLWVRIEKDRRTVYATGVSSGFNNVPTMLFTFPEAGEYTVYIRFQQEGMEKMAEAEFPITVAAGSGQVLPLPEIGLSLLVGVFSGVGGFYLLKNRPQKKKTEQDK